MSMRSIAQGKGNVRKGDKLNQLKHALVASTYSVKPRLLVAMEAEKGMAFETSAKQTSHTFHHRHEAVKRG